MIIQHGTSCKTTNCHLFVPFWFPQKTFCYLGYLVPSFTLTWSVYSTHRPKSVISSVIYIYILKKKAIRNKYGSKHLNSFNSFGTTVAANESLCSWLIKCWMFDYNGPKINQWEQMESHFLLTSRIKSSFSLRLLQPTDIVMSKTQLYKVKQHLVEIFAVTGSWDIQTKIIPICLLTCWLTS